MSESNLKKANDIIENIKKITLLDNYKIELYSSYDGKKLSLIDSLFPPHDIWLEFYMVDNIHEIISTCKRVKKRLSDV